MIDLEGSLAELIDEILPIKSGMIKTEADLARYQAIIDKQKPQIIIETGFAYGGSAKWFAQRVPRVISIEVNKPYIDAVTDLPSNVTTVLGESGKVVDHVRNLVGDEKNVMLSLDSDHGCPVVLEEMNAYCDLVPHGGYMVVEDGIFRHYDKNWYNGSPLDAIDKFLAGPRGLEFANDLEIEDMFPRTQHPGGWLTRGIPISYGRGDDLG